MALRRIASQHHHDAWGCGLRGEILGVSGEQDAGLVDDAL